jgi:hypothetical protein
MPVGLVRSAKSAGKLKKATGATEDQVRQGSMIKGLPQLVSVVCGGRTKQNEWSLVFLYVHSTYVGTVNYRLIDWLVG